MVVVVATAEYILTPEALPPIRELALLTVNMFLPALPPKNITIELILRKLKCTDTSESEV